MSLQDQKKIALKIDDIGVSAKKFEVYSKKWFELGIFLFLKYLSYFKAWGGYREMSADEWYAVFDLLTKYNAKLTVGVTVTWVNYDGASVYFFENFKDEAKALQYGLKLEG